MRTYAQLTTSLVVFVNRVGVEESVSFWGGSEVIAPSGRPIFSAPLYDEGLFVVDVDLADIRRERIGLPLLRDERLELEVRELQRIVAERAGFAHDSTADDDAGPGLDVAPIPRHRRLDPMTATADDKARRAALFELPDELAIDTDVARRVIAGFIRGQLRQAGFERAVLGLSGGIDSALVAYLVAEAIGADNLLAVLMPYRTSSAASRRTMPRRSWPTSAAPTRSWTSARWSTATSRPIPTRAPSGGATSWPASGWPCCTTAR